MRLYQRAMGGMLMSSAAASSVPTFVKKSIRWSIVISIVMIVAGIFAMIIPPAAGIAVTIFVGWMLVFSGILHFVYAWQSRETRAAVWEVLLGILYVFIGGYLLWNPILGLASLTFALAIYLLAEAVLEFILAYRLRPAPGSGWLAVDGVITLILAIFIWRTWPSNVPWVLGFLVGISMLFSGVARLMLSLAAKRVVEKLA
jgi:uncharacterized membrane protein HdeD (DUF308 family)